VGGRVANDLSPGDCDLAMVFQDDALLPGNMRKTLIVEFRRR
jgi:ABC-type sugar transport system ATPase subunit